MNYLQLVNHLKEPIWGLRDTFCELKASHQSRGYCIANAYRRIYHFHIRKSAGTSLNSAFWRLAGLDLKSVGRNLYSFQRGYVFVLNSKAAINRGNYFFASSHNPAHQLNLPDRTFTITVLRSPIDRALSYYRYLHYIKNDPSAKQEDPFWAEANKEAEKYLVDASFHGFLDRVAPYDLTPQLHMFSKTFNLEQALENATRCSAILFTENFDNGILDLGKTLDLPLKNLRERQFRSSTKEPIMTPTERDRLTELLEKEIIFYEKMRALRA